MMLSLLLLATTASAALTSLGTKDTIVQLFEWPWDSIASECSSTLGPAGYGYVQTSTPHEHIQGTQWWTDYQVVTYNITSKRGSRDQFSNMVSACQAAGVGIIIDLVSNHMTGPCGADLCTGIGGTEWSKYDYGGIYDKSHFHHCAGNGTALDITNYGNRYNAQFCEETGLADLAQEQPYVQDQLAKYLQDLQSLGVAGFRVDSSVQQPATNLTDILSTLEKDYWATYEVNSGSSDAVMQNEYWAIGSTMAFVATSELQTQFQTSGIANLVTPNPMGESWGYPWYPPSNSTNIFVTNHDMERNGGSLNHSSPNNMYVNAHVFILGFNYGVPEVFSGYTFTDKEAGQTQDEKGLTDAVVCRSSGWTCDHRLPAIMGMVGFHNTVGNESLANVLVGSTNQQVAFGRGAVGYLVINNEASEWSATFQTGLPAGNYCDVIHGNTTGCVSSIQVDSSGEATFTVPSYDAIAFYTQPASQS